MNIDNIHWLGHDSFLIRGSRILYFDPWEIKGPKADLICVTHEHYDHLDPKAIAALSTAQTRIFTNKSAAEKLNETGCQALVSIMTPGDKIEFDEVIIQAVPSYNIDKAYHPKSSQGLGFIVTMDGESIYHAGDSDFIPEMKDIKTQVALLPVSGTYVMTAEEAAEAALAIRPETAIPMHYSKIIGDLAMAEKFAAKLEGRVKVVIKAMEKASPG